MPALVAVKGPSRLQSLEEGKVGQGMRRRRSHQGTEGWTYPGRNHRDEQGGAETQTLT